MKRTKPTKKDEKELKQAPDLGFGGHMPYPPEGCPATRQRWVGKPEVEFIDCSSCVNCEYTKMCKRKKEHSNNWKKYWEIYRQIKDKYTNEQADEEL